MLGLSLTLIWLSNPQETPRGENSLVLSAYVFLHPCPPPLLKGVNLPWNASLAFRAIKRSHYISINLPCWLAGCCHSRRWKGSCFLLTAAGLEGKAFSLQTHCLGPWGSWSGNLFRISFPSCQLVTSWRGGCRRAWFKSPVLALIEGLPKAPSGFS